MARVLVTGATGFVGRVMCETLASSGHAVRAVLRDERNRPSGVTQSAVVGDLAKVTDWAPIVDGADAVVHLAARAHVLNDPASNADLYAITNAEVTRRLAQACEGRVRRLVFLSSIKVNGEETPGQAYGPLDEPQPLDAYGRSKLEAERALNEIGARGRLECVIVRPPLVYGSGVRANFLRLLQWVDRERWLPLGAVRNRRSLVSVWNLCAFLTLALEHPVAAGRTWMISDGEDISTPELIRRMADTLQRRARLLSVPPSLLRLGGTLLGRGPEVARLCGSLAVDVSLTRSDLGWAPALDLYAGLARTAKWYRLASHPHAGCPDVG